MRAHFSYDGTNDDEVPCKALALVLHKEDILEVVQQDDPNWWQVGVTVGVADIRINEYHRC